VLVHFVFALLLCNYCMYCRGAIRAQSLAAPVILSVLNVHVILLFQTNKPDDHSLLRHVRQHKNKIQGKYTA